MRIPRIYHPEPLVPHQEITLTSQAARHLSLVLKYKPEAALILFNGQGGEYPAVIKTITKRDCRVLLKDHYPIERESSLKIQLGQALTRSDRMDLIIQKATELGVNEITPLITEHSTIKLTQDKIKKRLDHWQAIIINACEQSGRNTLPIIHQPQKINDWLTQQTSDLKCIFTPTSQTHLNELTQKPKTLSLLIGSEGGLSAHEVTLAESKQFQAINLGPRILRTETATISTLSIAQSLWGDF